MAKSALSKQRNKNHKPTASMNKPTHIDATLFMLKVRGEKRKHELSHWKNRYCDAKTASVADRSDYINKLIIFVRQSLSEGVSQATLNAKLTYTKSYIKFCDRQNVPAFNVEGLKAYHIELWRQIDIYKQNRPYLFQYPDGEELGLKESSTAVRWVKIIETLSACGLNTLRIEASFRDFTKGDRTAHPAYQNAERKLLLTRLQAYFFELAVPLLANSSNKPITEVVCQVDGSKLNVSTAYSPGDKGSTRIAYGAPFNQAMVAGYYLLSYYTAFNDSVLREIRHPLKVNTDTTTSPSARWYQLSAFKARANKTVQALIGDDLETLQGECNKSGLKFIQTLEALSKKFNTNKYGSLLYQLNEQADLKPLNLPLGTSSLSVKLHLTSHNVHHVADHLVAQFCLLTTKRGITEIKTSIDETGFTTVQRKLVTYSTPNQGACPLAFCILMAIAKTEVDLKGALLPLDVTNLTTQEIRVRFVREDGCDGEFICDAKYKQFLDELQNYADSVNPPIKHKRTMAVNRTRYLLPFGDTGRGFRQWNNFAPDASKLLQRIGLRSGDYYLDLNSSRLRETNAQLIRNHSAEEADVSVILGNTLAIAIEHYARGNPEENQLILSQGMQVLEKIASGKTISEAKEAVISTNRIKVLTIDELSHRDGYLNAVGYFCSGRTDQFGEHKKTARRAQNLGFDKDNLACFQYDQCHRCEHAKLVDDIEAVYRQLSFIQCLEEGVNYFPESIATLHEKSQSMLEALEANLPEASLEKAIDRLLNKGRHPLYHDVRTHAALHIDSKI
jgi:hypothetical protein